MIDTTQMSDALAVALTGFAGFITGLVMLQVTASVREAWRARH